MIGAERFDVRLREVASGLEDFVDFDHRPAREALAYRIDLGTAAGLRLVDDTLELLDAGGAPRLRMSAPTIVDAAGRSQRVRVTVAGCAVDRDARAPWGRKVLAPGARACRVELAWGGAIGAPLPYPAVLDPAWVKTDSLSRARHHHTAVRLPDGRVLVAGGYPATGTTYLSSTELFDPATRTWAAAAPMTRPRANTQAVLFPEGPLAGQVLLAGGDDALLKTSELYDPASGTWTALPEMVVARDLLRVERLAGGEVLAVGGCFQAANGACAGLSASGETFDPATLTWTRVELKLADTRAYFSLTALDDGRALVAGGCERFEQGDCTDSLTTAAIFDPVTRSFDAIAPMPQAIQNHEAWRLGDGSVMVAGGSRRGHVALDAYRYRPGPGTDGAWDPPTVLGSAHVVAAGVVLPDGRLLLTGSWGVKVGAELARVVGLNGGGNLASAETELFDPTLDTWSPGPSLVIAHGAHSATLLEDGAVLVAGGYTSTAAFSAIATAAAEVYDPTILSLACGDPLGLEGSCARCGQASCCDELAACADDPACAPLGACFAMCGVGSGSYACLADCARTCGSGADAFTALAACVVRDACYLACVEDTGSANAEVRCPGEHGDEGPEAVEAVEAAEPSPEASEDGPEASEDGPEASEDGPEASEDRPEASEDSPDAGGDADAASDDAEPDATGSASEEHETEAGPDADDTARAAASDGGCSSGGEGGLALVAGLALVLWGRQRLP